jgi:APA family basic amino acid/polyamine antiporter
MIGSGVFLLPASLAAFGGITMWAWVISAAGSVMLALVFAHLSRRNPAAGGVYAYTRDAYGDFAGFLVAWGYWISMWSANAALAVAFVGYAGPVITGMSPSMPDIVHTPLLAGGMAIATLWFLTGVNSLASPRRAKSRSLRRRLPLPLVWWELVACFHSTQRTSRFRT